MMPVYLSALGIACTLGLGKQEVAKALFHSSSNPIQSEERLISGKSVPVGRLPFDLPELPEEFLPYRSRNNRLLKAVLDEIRIPIEESIAKYGASRVGIVMATSTSGMFEEEQAFMHKQRTGNELDGYHYSQTEISSPSEFASRYLGVQGPAYTISTACSSGGKALCSAKRLITAGICDAVIVGGVDTLCGLTLNGFDSLELMSKNVSLPFSKNRAGITIGEGAAVFLATREGTIEKIELSGCGESTDAYHICSPEPSGLGAEAAIRNALASADLKPEEICYINLHGTGTPSNDSMESIAIHRIFGGKLPCSSTKALTGHTLGASGSIEAAFLWLALKHEADGKIPLPTHRWDEEKDPTLPAIYLTHNQEFATPINGIFALMSNSFAFGGSNVSIILKKQRSLDPCLNYINDLVPHDPPMVLIDHLVSFRDDFIHGRAIIKEDSPFCENGLVPSYVALEYMAQMIATWNGLMSKRRGGAPKIGFLLGSRRLDLNAPFFKTGDILDVYGKVQYLDGEMGSFECWIDIKGIRAAHTAAMSVYQPNEIGEIDGK